MLSQTIISRLEYQHFAIPEMITGVDEKRIHLQPAPGKWSIHDNIAHLARYNVVFMERIKKILSAPAPEFPRYAAEEDAEFPMWMNRKTEELLSSIVTERKKILDLAKSIPENELDRTGIHPKFGKLDVAGWLEFFLLHEAHHIFTIFRIKNDVSIPA